MSVNIQVLCCGLFNSSPCLVLNTDNFRIVFDVGEGIQRLCVEHKVRLNKVEHICLTQLSTERIGGLPGLLLTAADAGKSSIIINGPENLQKFWDSTEYFMHKDVLRVNVNEITSQNITHKYQDFQIHVLHLSGNQSLLSQHQSCNDKLCYICELPPVLGKFDIVKAKELNIPKGPLYGELKNGRDIILPDGRVIQASQVVGPSSAPRAVAVIPSISPEENDILEMLVNLSEWNRFQVFKTNDGQVQVEDINVCVLDCLVHLSPLATLQSPLYLNWMQSFGTNVTHIGIGSKVCLPVSAYVAATRYANKLNILCPALFPHLNLHQSVYKHMTEQASPKTSFMLPLVMNENGLQHQVEVVRGSPMLKYIIQPARLRGLDISTSVAQIYLHQTEILSQPTDGMSDGNKANDSIQTLQMTSPSTTSTSATIASENISVATSNTSNGVATKTLPASAVTSTKLEVEVSEYWKDLVEKVPTLPLQLEELETFRQHVLSESDSNNCHITETLSSSALEHASYHLDSPQAEILRQAGSSHKIYFLGTGSAVPSKYRNVSGIYLQLSGGAMLLDVGEGSWLQLLTLAANSNNFFSDSNYDNNSFSNMKSTENASCDNFTKEDSDDVLSMRVMRTLRMVWISHPHADHHLGLIRILSERKRLSHLCSQNNSTWPPLLVIAPPAVLAFLQEYSDIDSTIRDSYIPISTRLLDAYDLCEGGDVYWGWQRPWKYSERDILTSNLQDTVSDNGLRLTGRGYREEQFVSNLAFMKSTFCQLGLGLICVNSGSGTSAPGAIVPTVCSLGVQNVKVIHCKQAYGVRIDSLDGWSVVYSGDTRPCPSLVTLGRGCTILIHEATFEDSKVEDAVSKNHSTIAEALDVAKDMDAFRVILTHFSQRYPSMPPLTGSDFGATRTILAFDYMGVSFADLLWAPKLTAILSEVFPATQAEADAEDNTDEVSTSTVPNSQSKVVRKIEDVAGTRTSKNNRKSSTNKHDLSLETSSSSKNETTELTGSKRKYIPTIPDEVL